MKNENQFIVDHFKQNCIGHLKKQLTRQKDETKKQIEEAKLVN